MPKARRWVQSQVTGWGVRLDDATRDAIEVITSELATNAVRHTTGTMITLGVYVHPRLRRLMVEVYDGSSALPRPRPVGPDDASGRGMFLVQRLAAAHGAELTERGKKVWVELKLPEQPLTRRQLLAHPRRAARAVARRLGGRRRPPIHPAAPAHAS